MPNSNFAVLMDLYDVAPKELSIEIGSDLTLISRWRTCSRRIVQGRKWAKLISNYFVKLDGQRGDRALGALLEYFYPTEELDSPDGLAKTTERWLTTLDQFSEDYQARRAKLLQGRLVLGAQGQPQRYRPDARAPLCTEGEAAVRDAIIDMLEKALSLEEPVPMHFVCPEGLALITRDTSFSARLMDKLEQLFHRGFRLQVVLCTDYKLSEVSAFSGRWLAAHLRGYVKSYYYSDIMRGQDTKMLATLGDRIAMRVLSDEKTGVMGEFYYNVPGIKQIHRQMEGFFGTAFKRFHYDYFPTPQGFMQALADLPPSASYCFTRLPHFNVHGPSLAERANLSAAEAQNLAEQFSPLLQDILSATPDAPVFHALSAEEIEEALDKPRHRAVALSDICGRRVYMTTQSLVDQLVHMRDALRDNRNYQLCLLPAAFFDELGMELAVQGQQAAVGWIGGETSTACKDPSHVAILQGFCSVAWGRIPAAAKNRAAAAKRLSNWLRRAKNFGYTVK